MVKQIRDYVLEARQIRESKEQKNEANNYFASKAKRTMQKHNDMPKDVEFGFSSYAELLDDKEYEMKELQKFVTQEYEEASRKATGFDENSQFGAFFQGYAEAMKKVQDKLK